MEIRRLRLTNFRRFESLDFEFPKEKIIILTGENGSGKTSILDAIAKCFSHYVGKIISYSDNSHRILDYLETSDIKNGTAEVKNECFFDGQEDLSHLTISKRLDEKGSKYDIVEEYFEKIREEILSNQIGNLPLFVYYRVNRTLFSNKNNRKITGSERGQYDQRKVSESEEPYSGSYFKPILKGYENCLNPYISPFIDFDNWYIQMENAENEKIKELEDFDYQNPQLEALRKIAYRYLSHFYNTSDFKIRVSRQGLSQSDWYEVHPGEIFIDFAGSEESVMLSQLSAGEKMIFYIVMDIARRLLILNKGNTAFENHDGIVLIDEIDLHLHPRWQRNILPALHAVFPGLQFICTTHSPQVLSSVRKASVLELDEKINQAASDPFGGESNRILEEILDTTERPKEVQELIEEIFFDLETEFVHFEQVDQKIEKLKDKVSVEDPVFLRIENFKERRKLLIE